MFRTLAQEGLTFTQGGKTHEVDSIIDCSIGLINKSKFQMELCCHCCRGRTLWLTSQTVMRDGNAALRSLAH